MMWKAKNKKQKQVHAFQWPPVAFLGETTVAIVAPQVSFKPNAGRALKFHSWEFKASVSFTAHELAWDKGHIINP